MSAKEGFFSTTAGQVLLGLFIVLIIVGIVYTVNRMTSTAATGSSGGVTTADHAQAASSGSSGASAPIVTASVTTPAVPLVKYILVSKNTTGMTVTPPSSRTFQIGEIKAYRSDGTLLTADDYSGAEYNSAVNTGVALTYPAKNAIDGNVNTFTHTNGETAEFGVHELKLTLRNPTNVGRVEVINRVDCCADRLAGAVIQLIAENGVVLKSLTLTDAATQTLA